MSASAEQFQTLVHRGLNVLIAARRDDDQPAVGTIDQLLAVCGPAAAEVITSERWRWRGHKAARHVATYLAFLQPPAGWRLIDADVVEAPTGTLLWDDGSHVLADVVATGGRDAQVWTRHSSGLPRRLVRAGRDRYASRFAGVRLLALAAPGRSLLVAEPTGGPIPLVSTPWWFHPTPLEGHDLVLAAAGEVPA